MATRFLSRSFPRNRLDEPTILRSGFEFACSVERVQRIQSILATITLGTVGSGCTKQWLWATKRTALLRTVLFFCTTIQLFIHIHMKDAAHVGESLSVVSDLIKRFQPRWTLLLRALFSRMVESNNSPQQIHFHASNERTKSRNFSADMRPLHLGHCI